MQNHNQKSVEQKIDFEPSEELLKDVEEAKQSVSRQSDSLREQLSAYYSSKSNTTWA